MEITTNSTTNTDINNRHPVYMQATRLYRLGYCSVDAALSEAERYRIILAEDLADEFERLKSRHRLMAVEAMLADVDRIARSEKRQAPPNWANFPQCC